MSNEELVTKTKRHLSYFKKNQCDIEMGQDEKTKITLERFGFIPSYEMKCECCDDIDTYDNCFLVCHKYVTEGLDDFFSNIIVAVTGWNNEKDVPQLQRVA